MPKKQGDGGKDLPTEAKKLQLNSAEELYAEIRDKNFNAVGSVLSKKAKVISAAFEVSCSLALLPARPRLDRGPPGRWEPPQVQPQGRHQVFCYILLPPLSWGP